MSEFDLDGFIGDAVDHFAAKYPQGDVKGRRIQRAFDDVRKDFDVRDRIERRAGPKLTVRDGQQIWTPRG